MKSENAGEYINLKVIREDSIEKFKIKKVKFHFLVFLVTCCIVQNSKIFQVHPTSKTYENLLRSSWLSKMFGKVSIRRYMVEGH